MQYFCFKFDIIIQVIKYLKNFHNVIISDIYFADIFIISPNVQDASPSNGLMMQDVYLDVSFQFNAIINRYIKSKVSIWIAISKQNAYS